MSLEDAWTEFLQDVQQKDLPFFTAASSLVYCLACVVFRKSIHESYTVDELTQLFAASLLSAALMLEPRANQPWTIVVALAIIRWTYIIQIRGPLFNAKTALDMSGKVVVLTGGTSGVGLDCAREIVKHFPKAKLILACRDTKKGEAVRQAMLQSNASLDVVVECLDLESFKSIRAFAERCNATLDKVDVLVNNAGAMITTLSMSKEDSIERMFQTNCLSPFLLSCVLLPLLSKPGSMRRIVNVTSSTSKLNSPIRFDDLDFLERPHEFTMLRAYAHSKICLNLATVELAKRLSRFRPPYSVLLCHPGAVQTDVTRDWAFWLRWGHKSIRMFCKKGPDGCQTLLQLIASREVEGVTGKYYEHMQTVALPAKSDEEAQQLFKLCEERTKVQFDAVLKQIE